MSVNNAIISLTGSETVLMRARAGDNGDMFALRDLLTYIKQINSDYNTIAVIPDNDNRVYDVAGWKIDNAEHDLYLYNDTDYITASHTNAIAFQMLPLTAGDISRPATSAYRINNDYNGLTAAGVGYNPSAITINGTNYIFIQFDSKDRPVYFYTEGTFKDMYINENKVVTYHWKSVPYIKGEFGQINLPVIKETAINDGNPVTGANINAFQQLPDESLIRRLSGTEESKYVVSEALNKYLLAEHYQDIYYNFEFRSDEYTDPYDYPSYFVNVTNYPNEYYLSILIDEDNEVARFSGIYRSGADSYTYNNENPMALGKMQELYTWLQGVYDNKEINEDTGEPEDWTPRPSQPINAPKKPDVSAINTGFTSMYLIKKTEVSELIALSEYMWSNNWIEVVAKWFSDPSEVIVGLSMFPIEPDGYEQSTTPIKAGGIVTTAQAHKLTDQYRDIKIGSIHIDTAGDNFLDFEPFTKVTAVLPYCGEHSLNVSDVMDKDLELHYLIDFYSGACVSYILVDGSCNYIFAGQMGNQVPISKSSYNQMISSILSSGVAIGGAISSLATGGMTAPLTLGSTMILNGMTMHPEVSFTSGGGGTTGMIGNQECYIRFEEPIPKLARNQNEYLGRVAYMRRQLSSCSGYTKVIDAHLLNITSCVNPEDEDPIYYPATEGEKTEILNDLKAGVIIETGTDLPDLTPSTSLDHVIYFCHTSSENNVIGKTFDTEGAALIEGKLLYDQSISRPKFVIQGDLREYNYCYIPDMGRYYFIDDIVLQSGGLEVVNMHVDVLNSFKDSILNCYAILERQKTKTNKYFNDAMYWTQQNKNTPKQYFHDNLWNNASFDSYDDCYILTVAGA